MYRAVSLSSFWRPIKEHGSDPSLWMRFLSDSRSSDRTAEKNDWWVMKLRGLEESMGMEYAARTGKAVKKSNLFSSFLYFSLAVETSRRVNSWKHPRWRWYLSVEWSVVGVENASQVFERWWWWWERKSGRFVEWKWEKINGGGRRWKRQHQILCYELYWLILIMCTKLQKCNLSDFFYFILIYILLSILLHLLA